MYVLCTIKKEYCIISDVIIYCTHMEEIILLALKIARNHIKMFKDIRMYHSLWIKSPKVFVLHQQSCYSNWDSEPQFACYLGNPQTVSDPPTQGGVK